MKGVIVQIGEPKSIVLFNNGKIAAIPTPANCHVGMVVTVKYRSLLKILIVAAAAVFLIALGIFIGAAYGGGSDNEPYPGRAWREDRHRRMMEQYRRPENAPPNLPPSEMPMRGRRPMMME